MKFFLAGIVCLAATALLAKSLRHNESANAVQPSRIAESQMLQNTPAAPVKVGTAGNEPIVTIAPDGTLYISALQHIYRSIDGGATWTNLAGPPEAGQINLNSDSSISVDPGNRLYFTFDYPYAGTTAVCTSDDKGDTWSCDPAVVPGGTDRMWVFAPTTTAAYEVTNEGLYQTAFLKSTDRGTTWVPRALGTGILEPQTGPLLQKNCSGYILQVIKVFGTLPSDVPELKLYVYDPSSTSSVTSAVRGTGLGLPTALPSASLSPDGELWVVSEEANAAGGRQVVLARSGDEGVTWTKLPPIPGTTAGTATFTWVAAGAPGHVGIIYYQTPDNSSDPGTLTASTWSAMWAESYDAEAVTPTWTVTTLENAIHTGAICAAASCSGTNRFSGDFINAIIDSRGAAHLTWIKQTDTVGTTEIHYKKIQSAPPSTFVPLPCSLTPSVVSRMTHGSAGRFDIPLAQPPATPRGVECRSGGPNGDYTMVFTFPTAVESCGMASVSGCGGSASSSTGPTSNQCTVNLTGVSNACYLTVTLTGVVDTTDLISNISGTMGVLIGDVTANGVVTNTDVSVVKGQVNPTTLVTQANFREDVTVNGFVTNTDVSVVKGQVNPTGGLPSAP